MEISMRELADPLSTFQLSRLVKLTKPSSIHYYIIQIIIVEVLLLDLQNNSPLLLSISCPLCLILSCPPFLPYYLPLSISFPVKLSKHLHRHNGQGWQCACIME